MVHFSERGPWNRRVSVSLSTGEIFCVSKDELKSGLTCQKHASFSFEQCQRLKSRSVTVTSRGTWALSQQEHGIGVTLCSDLIFVVMIFRH